MTSCPGLAPGIFVDQIFTTLIQSPFTNAFDVFAQTAAFPCVYRAGNAD
jgi:hypothetical protein